MSRKNTKNKSLSEKVAESLNHNLTESENDSDNESGPKVVDFEEDDYEFQKDDGRKSFSAIRKQNVKLLHEQSAKYSGEVASRKDLAGSDGDSSDFGEDTMEVDEDDDSDAEGDFDEEEENKSSQSLEDSDMNQSTDEGEESSEENLVSTKNSKQELEKGLCVQNQLSIWEKLLEVRIHSQKILTKANSLPCPEKFTDLSADKVFKESVAEASKNAENLLQKLIETQTTLASQFSEIKKLGLSSRIGSNSKLPKDKSQSSRYAPLIKSNFDKFRPYRNSVLLKWDDRTKLLASSGAKKGKQLGEEFDIVRKVDNVLIKLDDQIEKSQKVKGNYTLFGHKPSEADDKVESKKEVSNPHVYDDTDFYHSQLRELIEFKSDVSTNAYNVTKQYAELQKLRQKMKKKVDTRASKGRKIRYVVHHKLMNFMAPNNASEWTDESKNELYRSLFAT